MADVAIVASAVANAPQDYTLPGAQEIFLRAVGCTMNGTNATGSFVPALQMLDPAGHVMWTAVNSALPVAAGRSALVSWFPGGGVNATSSSSSSSGTISRITSNAGTLTVTTPTGPTTNLDMPATGVTPGTYGDSGHVSQVTLDSFGRATNATSVSISGGGTVVGADGWVTDPNGGYTFASATSFTVGATDLTATYSKGTRIKLTQTTTKFFVVTSSSFGGGTTTVNITGGTDFTLVNAAITNPFYSYVPNPQAWPGGFNFTPSSIVGWAATPTVSRATFSVIGTLCFVDIRITGTSNATTVSFGMAIAGVTTADGQAQTVGACVATDAGTPLTTPSRCTLASASVTATMQKDFAATTWTNSGTKQVTVAGTYRI